MAFRPHPPHIQRIAWPITAALLVLSLLLLFQMLRTPPGPALIWLVFVLLVFGIVGVVLLYRLIALRQLDYWVDRDAVRIFWAGDILVLPMANILRVEKQGGVGQIKPRWWLWPVQWVSTWTPDTVQSMYATMPPEDCVALVTRHGTVLVNPSDAEGFIDTIKSRQILGPVRDLNQEIQRSAIRFHWLYRDHVAQALIGLGLLSCLLLFGYVIWFFPQLPESIPLHFDASGFPDRISPRRSLFFIPAITFLIWFFNATIGIVLFERVRVSAYILWTTALMLQIAGLMVVRNLLALAIP